ncbi:trafficking protein particle complex subunit 6A isoform X3 [Trachypithecus francoisi]|uniref:trafficking protein particle complex subunit 6A isoform X3 n=1 Tax=Trachypithecus francoisi TaxID=54180 RepID=UPI00141B4022|nr:trafficking protein particle complex subunit 6A isoform X3 [Trachypithecus francoisi]
MDATKSPCDEGQKMSLSVLEGMGFRVGQALGERSRWTACAPITRWERPSLPIRLPPEGETRRVGGEAPAPEQRLPDPPRAFPQGTYVLQDNSFPLLLPMASGLQYLEEAPKFLAFTCGLLRGALCTLGIESVVTASVAALPICKFQVVIPKS